MLIQHSKRHHWTIVWIRSVLLSTKFWHTKFLSAKCTRSRSVKILSIKSIALFIRYVAHAQAPSKSDQSPTLCNQKTGELYFLVIWTQWIRRKISSLVLGLCMEEGGGAGSAAGSNYAFLSCYELQVGYLSLHGAARMSSSRATTALLPHHSQFYQLRNL